jgi:hypothetical protein
MQALSFAQAAASSIFATIDRVPSIDSSSPAGIKPDHVDGVIELSDVDFFYPSRPAVQASLGTARYAPLGSTRIIAESLASFLFLGSLQVLWNIPSRQDDCVGRRIWLWQIHDRRLD